MIGLLCRLVFRHQRFTQASKKAVIPGKQSWEDRGYPALGKSLINAWHLKQGEKKKVVVDSMKITAVAHTLVWRDAGDYCLNSSLLAVVQKSQGELWVILKLGVLL